MKIQPSKRIIMQTVADDIDDTGRIRLSQSDRDLVWRAAMISAFLQEIDSRGAGRLKLIDRGNWRLKVIKGLYEKFYDMFLNTIPFEQLMTVQRQLPNIGYSVGVKNIQSKYGDKDYGLFLTNAQFSMIIDALKDHCIVCDRDRQQQRKCALKKCLDSLPLEKDTVDANGNCVYLDAMMQTGEDD